MDVECVSDITATEPMESHAPTTPISPPDVKEYDPGQQPKSKIPIKLIPPMPEEGIDPSDSGSESEEEEEEVCCLEICDQAPVLLHLCMPILFDWWQQCLCDCPY